MFNKRSLIFLLTLHLVMSLKSNDFCILKQKECKGFYDKQHKYYKVCELIKCQKPFNNDCGFNICSIYKNKCSEYFNHYSKLTLAIPSIDAYFADRNFELRKKFYLFNKHIPECKSKAYTFKSKDFCSNGEYCFMVKNNAKNFALNRKIKSKIDCKCPRENSFKCGKYCTSNSIACDFFKSNSNKKNTNFFKKIINCGNNNTIFYK